GTGWRAAWAAAALVVLVGCSEDATGPDAPKVTTHTVDATDEAAWALVALGAVNPLVSVNERSTSTEWDLGFQVTSVIANGGAEGPGGVEVVCLCQNDGSTNEQYMTMTAATELADFESVTAADIPSTGWSASTFADRRWYKYNLDGQHQIWPTYDVYLVRRAGTVYKLQIIGYYGPAGEPRHITFRFAQLAG